MSEHLPPKPYALIESATASANGAFHLYLVDANGRKIAALWGTADEKIALGRMIVEASGADPDAVPVYAARPPRKLAKAPTRWAEMADRSAARASKSKEPS